MNSDKRQVQQLKVKIKANFLMGFVLINECLVYMIRKRELIPLQLFYHKCYDLQMCLQHWLGPRYLVPDFDFFENDWQET